MEAFLGRFVLPHNGAWHRCASQGVYPPFMEDLKALARAEGLWNLCLPGLREDEPGTRLNNLDYAPLAEAMGRLCRGRRRSSTAVPRTAATWICSSGTRPQPNGSSGCLLPLLEGEIRSAFAMSEPDVASSDPTNLQTAVRREGGELVINGRKWFITGAAHPACRLLVVMCRNDGDEQAASRHAGHSMVLVPMDAPGLTVVRNIPIMQHTSPEGHCEILLRNVRVRNRRINPAAKSERFAAAAQFSV